MSGPIVVGVLVDAGPVLGVFGGGKATEGRLGSVGVVLDAPCLDNDMGFDQRTGLLEVQESVADVDIELSTNGEAMRGSQPRPTRVACAESTGVGMIASFDRSIDRGET